MLTISYCQCIDTAITIRIYRGEYGYKHDQQTHYDKTIANNIHVPSVILVSMFSIIYNCILFTALLYFVCIWDIHVYPSHMTILVVSHSGVIVAYVCVS